MSEVLLNPQLRSYLLLLTLCGLLQEQKVRMEVNCPLAELDTAPSALWPPRAFSRALCPKPWRTFIFCCLGLSLSIWVS